MTDLDDDSDPDIAVAFYRTGTFTLIETNAGALGASRDGIYLPGARVDGLATGNLNGDTLPDLAILANGPSSEDASLAISLNGGALDFPGLLGSSLGDPTYYALPDDPRAVATGDIDGDGDEDVITAHGGGVIATLLNSGGSGTFSPATTTSVGGTPTALWLEDFDGDVDLDLAIADPGREAVLVLLNPGSGAFALPTLVSVDVDPQAIVAADFDDDGDVDLAVANQDLTSGNVSLLLNDGSGTFQEEGRYRIGRGISGPSILPNWAGEAIVAADVDRDGDIDLAVANSGTNDISVLLNRSNSIETASGDLALGATLSTDTEADGASWSDPVETAVTTPVAGPVSIVEGPIRETEPAGWRFVGQQVDVSAPTASAGDPLVLVFRVDASRLPPSIPPAATRVFKSGLLVPGCAAGSAADPDPCVAARSVLGDGDAQIEVWSSSASPWNFGYLRPMTYFVDLDLQGQLGLEPIRFTVPHWRLDLIGNVATDSDDDNLDEMSAEMEAMEATANSANYGEIKLRVRSLQSSPFAPSRALIEELTGQLPGFLELPPTNRLATPMSTSTPTSNSRSGGSSWSTTKPPSSSPAAYPAGHPPPTPPSRHSIRSTCWTRTARHRASRSYWQPCRPHRRHSHPRPQSSPSSSCPPSCPPGCWVSCSAY